MDVLERLQIIKVFIESDLIPVAEAELAHRAKDKKPPLRETGAVMSKTVAKRSEKISSEKRYFYFCFNFIVYFELLTLP